MIDNVSFSMIQHVPSSDCTFNEEKETMTQYINNAFQMLYKGNDTNYRYILKLLKSTKDTKEINEAKKKIYDALTYCLTSFAYNPSLIKRLLEIIFHFDFFGNKDVIDHYSNFLIKLVSSKTTYLIPILHLLIRNLCRPSDIPDFIKLKEKNNEIMEETEENNHNNNHLVININNSSIQETNGIIQNNMDLFNSKLSERFSMIHNIFQRMITIVPTCIGFISNILQEYYPYQRLETIYQVTYVNNLLIMASEYLNVIQDKILGLIIEKIVCIDVEIKLDLDEKDNDETIFTLDDFIDDKDALENSKDVIVDEMADKLDQLMVIVFEYLKNERNNKILFQHMLIIFEKCILSTHQSKYPQYFLFYLCHDNEEYQKDFLTLLLSYSLGDRDEKSSNVSFTLCQSSLSYIASFVSRAKYISIEIIKNVLLHLMHYLHSNLDKYLIHYNEDINIHNNNFTNDDHIFYSMVLQSAAYIVCFRGLEICSTKDGIIFLRKLGWEKIISGGNSSQNKTDIFNKNLILNPLEGCEDAVVIEFLIIAELLHLFQEDEVLDSQLSINQKRYFENEKKERKKKSSLIINKSKNKRSQIKKAKQIHKDPKYQLFSFFPFDPYLLRRSFHFISTHYIYWKNVDPFVPSNEKFLNSIQSYLQDILMEDEAEEENGDNDQDVIIKNVFTEENINMNEMEEINMDNINEINFRKLSMDDSILTKPYENSSKQRVYTFSSHSLANFDHNEIEPYDENENLDDNECNEEYPSYFSESVYHTLTPDDKYENIDERNHNENEDDRYNEDKHDNEHETENENENLDVSEYFDKDEDEDDHENPSKSFFGSILHSHDMNFS